MRSNFGSQKSGIRSRKILTLLLLSSCLLTPLSSLLHATTLKSEWVIRDPRLRARVIHSVEEYMRYAALDTSGARYVESHAHSAEVVVEAIDNREENTRRLVALIIDSVRIAATENVRVALGETLYDFVTARKSYEYDVNRTTIDERACEVLWWPEERVRASLDRQFVRVTPSFSVINEIGNHNLLLPWWHYGMFRIGVAHQNFRFLLQGPFTPGLQKTLFLSPRRIDGAFGGAFQFHVESWSGELAYSTVSRKSSLYTAYAALPYMYYVSTVAQIRYSVSASAGSLGAMQISFGGGLHKVKRDSLGGGPEFNYYDSASEPPLIVSPVFEASFVSTHDDVEITGQFYHTSLMFTAAVRITGAFWISGTALIVKPFRNPEPFEPESFYFISPEIRL